MFFCVCSLFYDAVLSVLSSFPIIFRGKRELLALFKWFSCSLVPVNVRWLFLAVPWVGLQCVFMVFPNHTYLHGKRKDGNIKRTICTEKRINMSLKDLSIALKIHGRNGSFSFLSSLPISVLRNFSKRLINFTIEQTNYIKQPFLQVLCLTFPQSLYRF